MMVPFFIWKDKNLKKIDVMTITALETTGNYTKVFFSDATYDMVRVSMKNALKLLPPNIFIRVSRKCAVSIYFINEIRQDEIIIQDRSKTNEIKPDEIIVRDQSKTNEIKPDEIIVRDRSITVEKGYFDLIKSQVKILGNKEYPESPQDEQNPNDDPDLENEDDDDV